MFGRSQRPFSLNFASFGGRFPADMAPKRLDSYFRNRKDWHTDMAKQQNSPFFLRWNRCRTLSEFLKVFGIFNLTFPLHYGFRNRAVCNISATIPSTVPSVFPDTASKARNLADGTAERIPSFTSRHPATLQHRRKHSPCKTVGTVQGERGQGCLG